MDANNANTLNSTAMRVFARAMSDTNRAAAAVVAQPYNADTLDRAGAAIARMQESLRSLRAAANH